MNIVSVPRRQLEENFFREAFHLGMPLADASVTSALIVFGAISIRRDTSPDTGMD
jgi:hypothetical protein